MNKEKAIQRLKSLRLNLQVHPDTEPNSEFEDRISDLDEVIEWMQKQDRWISVEDRLPEEAGDYMTYHEASKQISMAYYNESAKVFTINSYGAVCQYITHWQPLLEPPKR